MALIIIEFLSLDGVIQDPDGAEGTPWGGWAFRQGRAAVAGDKFRLGPLLEGATLLFGRRTWEHFATLWPSRTDDFATQLNAMPKLVASRRRAIFDDWKNSERLPADPLPEIDRIRRHTDLVLIGSTSLARQVINAGLVDEYRLLIFPCVIGAGERLFDPGDAIDLDLVSVEQKDATVLITYRTTAPKQGEQS
ncbi:dihydrofolate reductase family protein [Microlunatus sp. Gsoil 973]|uniref:dihydrofolate reductase family protein n=1 Tax=Microlunatus sp. Gsoil 973 TaxID=2672569 RepID=UPI0012B4EF4F|nr:dihydrofolate reductase family protein [Microlunatus sp. Gsoil 973]QGN31633.1 riboflavin biosynthesis protein RibD [Microlunatus sp. Gsoil 973]